MSEPIPDVVTVWSKPGCQQCRLVKFRLEAADVPFEERNITTHEHARDLEYFRGIGYTSVPITEYRTRMVPGLIPSEIDQIIAAWRADHPVEVTA